jgi:hypothetical protein
VKNSDNYQDAAARCVLENFQRKRVTSFRPLTVGKIAADISGPFELDLTQQMTAASRLWYKKRPLLVAAASVCVATPAVLNGLLFIPH